MIGLIRGVQTFAPRIEHGIAIAGKAAREHRGVLKVCDHQLEAGDIWREGGR